MYEILTDFGERQYFQQIMEIKDFRCKVNLIQLDNSPFTAIPELKILLALQYMERTLSIDHDIYCIDCGQPLVAHLSEDIAVAYCININCGKIIYSADDTHFSMSDAMKKAHVLYCLFDCEIFKEKSIYWQILPQKYLSKVKRQRKIRRTFRIIYKPYTKIRLKYLLFKMNKMFDQSIKKEKERKKLKIEQNKLGNMKVSKTQLFRYKIVREFKKQKLLTEPKWDSSHASRFGKSITALQGRRNDLLFSIVDKELIKNREDINNVKMTYDQYKEIIFSNNEVKRLIEIKEKLKNE